MFFSHDQCELDTFHKLLLGTILHGLMGHHGSAEQARQLNATLVS